MIYIWKVFYSSSPRCIKKGRHDLMRNLRNYYLCLGATGPLAHSDWPTATYSPWLNQQLLPCHAATNFLKNSAMSSLACYLFLIYLILWRTPGLASQGSKELGLFTTRQDMVTKHGTHNWWGGVARSHLKHSGKYRTSVTALSVSNCLICSMCRESWLATVTRTSMNFKLVWETNVELVSH